MTLTAYGRSVTMMDLSNSGTSAQGKKSVLLTDHLGSVDTVVDITTATPTVQGQSFDTFGKRRNAGSWQGGSGSSGTSSQHGFTDHEQLDNVGLVHMNGRVYDPTVGRFLSVDPVFQAPTNGQSVNPYSYVMNNPLSLVDPSGYIITPEDSKGGPDTQPMANVPSGCGTGEGVSACADSLQNGQTANITDANGNVVGTVGKDSNGNLLVTAGNGSNFNQPAQFTTTISSSGMVETSGGGVTVGSDSHGIAGNGAQTDTISTPTGQESGSAGTSASTSPQQAKSDNGIHLVPVQLNGLSTNMQHGEPFLNDGTYGKVDDWVAGVKAEYGYNLIFTNAFRTPADIDALEELGYKPVKDSLHMAGLSVDIDWNAVPKAIRSGVVAIAHAVGLSWGHDFSKKSANEDHHFYDAGPLGGVTRAKAIESAQQQYRSLSGGGN